MPGTARAGIGILLAVGILAGCTSTVAPYQPSLATTAELAGLPPVRIAVEPFAAATAPDLKCRQLHPILPPAGGSFAGFIRDALASELQAAGLLSDGTPEVTLSGRLDELTFGSYEHGGLLAPVTGLVDASWQLALTLRSSNGASLAQRVQFPFKTGFDGYTGCRMMAEAFPMAVQELVYTIVSSPDFPNLLRPAPGN